LETLPLETATSQSSTLVKSNGTQCGPVLMPKPKRQATDVKTMKLESSEIVQKSDQEYKSILEVEWEAMQLFFDSYDKDANYRGHKHSTIYTRMDDYVNYLISLNILTEENRLGRIRAGHYVRTGLRINLHDLHSRKSAIIEALNDKYDVIGAEVYQILQLGVTMAQFNGMNEIYDAKLRKFCELASCLPPMIQSQLLGSKQSRNYTIKAMAA
jgi:hypothetical protein